jgi:hypothetical protein
MLLPRGKNAQWHNGGLSYGTLLGLLDFKKSVCFEHGLLGTDKSVYLERRLLPGRIQECVSHLRFA